MFQLYSHLMIGTLFQWGLPGADHGRWGPLVDSKWRNSWRSSCQRGQRRGEARWHRCWWNRSLVTDGGPAEWSQVGECPPNYRDFGRNWHGSWVGHWCDERWRVNSRFRIHFGLGLEGLARVLTLLSSFIFQPGNLCEDICKRLELRAPVE